MGAMTAAPPAAVRADAPATSGWPPGVEGRGRITVWVLLGALRRRWYVAVIGAAATLFGTYSAAAAPGVYYQQAYVVFFAPNLPPAANAYQLVPSSLISAAGLVGRQVDDQSEGPLPVSSTVTVVDLGLQDDILVRIPNVGGQWATNFDRPVLDVQIVADSPEHVRARMTATVSKIRRVLRDGQLAAGAPPRQLIETGLNPPSPPVLYERGNRARTVGTALILGTGLTVAVARLLDIAFASSRAGARRARRSGRRWTSHDRIPVA
jgi:hypothetical protein